MNIKFISALFYNKIPLKILHIEPLRTFPRIPAFKKFVFGKLMWVDFILPALF